MALIMRVQAVWTGFVGAPGYSVFYHRIVGTQAAAAQDGHDSVWTFFNDLQGYLPADAVITVDPTVTVLDEATGDAVGAVVVATARAAIDGTSGAEYAAQAGVGVDWVTAQYLNGRLLRGRTYLVPAAGVFDTDGTLADAPKAAILVATGAIVSSDQDFVVWHRPVNGAGGQAETIASALVRDRSYTLRSRAR